VQTVSLGFNALDGILFDGSNTWVTDFGANTLLKLNSSGGILQTVSVGSQPAYLIFDGINIWVPNKADNSVTVVRASTGAVIATLTGNGLSSPTSAAFDGERILITNQGNNSVSLWKATDLTPLANFSTIFDAENLIPFGACSDGAGFFVTADFSGAGTILLF
jgi:DNA-binding beta-propeller fold protein YncE